MLTAEYDIVILALNRSDSVLNSSTWQLAQSLAESKRILYVNHPKSIIEAIKGLFKKKSKSPSVPNNITVTEPLPVLPINFLPAGSVYRFFKQINHRLLHRSILKMTRGRRFELFLNAFDFKYFPENGVLNHAAYISRRNQGCLWHL